MKQRNSRRLYQLYQYRNYLLPFFDFWKFDHCYLLSMLDYLRHQTYQDLVIRLELEQCVRHLLQIREILHYASQSNTFYILVVQRPPIFSRIFRGTMLCLEILSHIARLSCRFLPIRIGTMHNLNSVNCCRKGNGPGFQVHMRLRLCHRGAWRSGRYFRHRVGNGDLQ